MHIAFITPEYPHSKLGNSGGLGTSIKNLAQVLVAKGQFSTVFVVQQKQDAIIYDEGVKVISISEKKYSFLSWFLWRKKVEGLIKKEIKTENINAIEAPDWTGVSAFMKFSIPLVVRLNGSDAYFCKLEKRKQKFKNFFIEKIALKKADAIISVSDFTAGYTAKIFNLKQSIKTINNSIDTSKFKKSNEVVIKGQLLYFGTIIRKKGVLELAKAFNIVSREYPEVALVLLGKDAKDIFEDRSTLQIFLEHLSEDAKCKVKHVQEVTYEEVKGYVSNANVVLLPSFAEAFPMTWLETLAMEKALVSSNIGWAKELMVDGETGFTVNPREHKLFAKKIIQLLNDDMLCETFGKKGRKHVLEKFSVDVVFKKNLEFYNSLIIEHTK